MPKKQKNNANRPALVRHMRNAPKHYVNKKGALDSIIDPTEIQTRLAKYDEPEPETGDSRNSISLATGLEMSGVLSARQRQDIRDAQSLHASQLRIPRRPAFHPATTKEELQQSEEVSFHAWRGRINALATLNHITLTPFEKNLGVWRELWRTVERSDLVVQILDARNPLLFRCRDVETCVKEVDPRKRCLLLVNKADYLTARQREQWASYFNGEGSYAVFFSAKESTRGGLPKDVEEQEEGVEEERSSTGGEDKQEGASIEVEEKLEDRCIEGKTSDLDSDLSRLGVTDDTTTHTESLEDSDNGNTETWDSSSEVAVEESEERLVTTSRLYNREELVELLIKACPQPRGFGAPSHIGMVGYPNVGKSSTINCLLQGKKVRVSATPGKTKSLQTHILPDTSDYTTNKVILVDCPGLVFPGFATTKQEMILWGIFPIDRIRRDYHSPITLLCHTLPASYLEAMYSLPEFPSGNTRPPTNDELLLTYAVTRGFFAEKGRPDVFRAARRIMKDFMSGKLLHCIAPPGTEQEAYHTFHATKGKTFRLTAAQRALLPDCPAPAPPAFAPPPPAQGGTKPSARRQRRRLGVLEEL